MEEDTAEEEEKVVDDKANIANVKTVASDDGSKISTTVTSESLTAALRETNNSAVETSRIKDVSTTDSNTNTETTGETEAQMEETEAEESTSVPESIESDEPETESPVKETVKKASQNRFVQVAAIIAGIAAIGFLAALGILFSKKITDNEEDVDDTSDRED